MRNKLTPIILTAVLLAALLLLLRLPESDSPVSPIHETNKPAMTSAPEPQKGEPIYEPVSADDPVVSDKQAEIRTLIQSVYAMRDRYVSSLKEMEEAAKAEYLSLPEEDRTYENKESIAKRYIDAAYSLEAECDTEIDEVCAGLGELLLETDGDFSIISKVRYIYASEKAAMKDGISQTYKEFFYQEDRK